MDDSHTGSSAAVGEAPTTWEHRMGTTIVGVCYEGGVILGADSRTSTGMYVANRASDKIILIAVWREFVWGGIAGAFGEGMMHPVDTLKTRLQSQAIMTGASDGLRGDTLGSFVYVPCEVMKQRMQVQGTQKSWASAVAKGSISQTHGTQMYGYYNGMFHAGCSIWREHGLKGIYAGYRH